MKISNDFGIVVRKRAISEKKVNLLGLMHDFNFQSLYDESSDLISLGPFFGGDMADECMKSLEKLGLIYIDDFFIFDGDFPSWCQFSCNLTPML
jgi:hypothetical protein